MAFESKADRLFFGGSAGGGKPLPLSTPVPTPGGWATIGTLQVGDEVFDEQGSVAHVTGLSDIETPVTYEFTFDDRTTIRSGATHRWLTFTDKERLRLLKSTPEWQAARRAKRPSRATGNRGWYVTEVLTERNKKLSKTPEPPPTGKIRTTQEIVDTLKVRNGSRTNHAIPLAKALVLPEADLSDPYKAGRAVSRAKLYYRENQTISLDYMRGSYDQRLALLQGILDPGAYVNRAGSVEFETTNKRLATQVVELVVSLGIKTGITEAPVVVDGVYYGERWRLKFTTTVPVFRDTEKLAKLPTETRQTQQFRYIVDAQLVEPEPMRCISVDSPSRLYLAGTQMVPTHNSDLLLGAALTSHTRSIIFRRESKQLGRLVSRLLTIYGSRGGYSSHPEHRLALPNDRLIRFGGVQHPGDEESFQGQDHDYYGFDELTQFLESQFRYLITWNRTTKAKQRCRVIATGNPPTSPEGEWVIQYWAPWLESTHPNPAMPGELRWFISDENGEDQEVEDSKPIRVPWDDDPIIPLSRTFIASSVEDNPFLMAAGYKAQLQGLPEPLRSQMLRGDFTSGRDDNAWQVIPSAWVEAAQERWTPDRPKMPMSALGVDVAQGGVDHSVLVARYGDWFSEPIGIPGRETPDSPTMAGHVVAALRDGAPAHIDADGVGGEVYGHLNGQNANVVAMYGNKESFARALDNKMGFFNTRSERHWRMREALDPSKGSRLALPKHPRIKADLCAPRWSLQGRGKIKVEAKEDIIKRIGRSPDYGDAIILAMVPGNENGETRRKPGTVTVEGVGGYDPLSY